MSTARSTKLAHYPNVLLLKLCIDDLDLREKYREHILRHNTRVVESNYYDSGFDLLTPSTIRVVPGDQLKLDYGIKCAAYNSVLTGLLTFENQTNTIYANAREHPSAFYIYPRSSIASTPLRLANSVGIIDSGYRGNLIGKFDSQVYTGVGGVLEVEHEVIAGSRLLQICAPMLQPILVEIVDSLDETERGAGGFGSTP
jgi:dUTP pyrophosphatase